MRSILSSFIIRPCRLAQMSLVEMTWLDLGSVEIIKLRSSSVLGLRKPDPAASKSDESGSTKDEANLATKVTGIWVEHVREHETNQPLNDTEDDVGKALGS